MRRRICQREEGDPDMIGRPLFSIVINNYNYGRFLDDAIRSALRQTYSPLEVIVVDDGSTDNSRDIIASYGSEVIPVLKDNGGQPSALNAGFGVSKGEIILFLDADDYLLPETVERVVRIWTPDVAKVQHRLSVIDATGHRLRVEPPHDIPLPSGQVLPLVLKKGHYPAPPQSGNSFARSALERIFPLPETDGLRWCSDYYLSVLVSYYGEVRSIEDPLGIYRLHGNNNWSSTVVDASRFRRSVETELARHALLLQWTNARGFQPPPDLTLKNWVHLRARLSSVRLDRARHPVASDHRLRLVWWGLRALWGDSSASWKERVLSSLWFLWVGLLPLPLVRAPIAWLVGPQTRPRVVERMLHSSGPIDYVR
jgi:glycosyltransferase involved in cell wall biosynthesis